MLGPRFSIFGSGNSNKAPADEDDHHGRRLIMPTLKLQTDKDVYGPGDSVSVTVEIHNNNNNYYHNDKDDAAAAASAAASSRSLLIERLGFEIKGIEKLDPQWFATHKPLPGSAHRRGEHVFMDCSTSSMVSSQILSSSAVKRYAVRTVLPGVIPPSYRGATIRYLYYVKCTFSGRWLVLENSHSLVELTKDPIELEARIPLQVWVTQKSNGLLMEDVQTDGVVPTTTIPLDLFWKEIDGDSEWTRANDLDDGVDNGYESFRDEISSVSSYNAIKENVHKNLGGSLSFQSFAGRSFNSNASHAEIGRTSLSSIPTLPRLSVAEVSYEPAADVLSPGKSSAVPSPGQQQKITEAQNEEDSRGLSSASRTGNNGPGASEGFVRGRSYNIRIDDQVLLRFSPKNSESTYYFSDTIGGTLTFFHEEGPRRCLEVSITLETLETVNQRSIHPSRRNCPMITKVQSDHHEVVADMVQTSFLFSVPMDGPMSFSTRHVSVQWALRFEFSMTPKNVDWTRYDHPLLIEGRDKSEWVLPITVRAPPPGTAAAHTRNERPFSLEPLWVRP